MLPPKSVMQPSFDALERIVDRNVERTLST
jgi:hypothetical protein